MWKIKYLLLRRAISKQGRQTLGWEILVDVDTQGQNREQGARPKLWDIKGKRQEMINRKGQKT